MHEAHKRVHDPQLVKHLPGRNHKANMVHLEGCCRKRCEVEYPYFKIYSDKNISLKQISAVDV